MDTIHERSSCTSADKEFGLAFQERAFFLRGGHFMWLPSKAKLWVGKTYNRVMSLFVPMPEDWAKRF